MQPGSTEEEESLEQLFLIVHVENTFCFKSFVRAIVANWIETRDATSTTESQTDSAVTRVISVWQLFRFF